MKRTPLRKKIKISTLKRRVWAGAFSPYIRLRDCMRTTGSLKYGECFTCSDTLPFNELDAGHFIPGRHNGNLFSERGCHAQCRTCNRFKDGNVLEYRRQVVELYGEGVDLELEEEARQIVKFTVDGLLELEAEIKEKIKLLEVSKDVSV